MIPLPVGRILGCAATAVMFMLITVGNAAYTNPSYVHAASTSANTLTLGWATEPTTLDPANSPYSWDAAVMNNIYDQLIRVGNDGTTLTPDLAVSWDISPDGTVYTFHLRSGVVFQNGQPLTAADVKFCLDRARNPSAPWSWTLDAISSTAAPDPATVVVTLSHPWAPFLSDVALFDTGVYPEAYFQSVGSSGLSANPIGTGPYMLDTWAHGQFLRLRKYPSYWMASLFPMQYVEFDLIPDSSTRLLDVESGTLDVDTELPFSQIAVAQHNPAVQAVIDPSTEITYFVPNSKFAPFGDVKVRQAISHAIDRSTILSAVLYGYGTVANSFLPKGALYYNPAIPVPSYDPTLAKQLLSESSAPNGFSMTVSTAAGDTTDNLTAGIFQNEMAAIGITVTIRQMDAATLYSQQQAGQIAFMSTVWTDDIPDPDELVNFAAAFAPGSWSFYTWYDNPQVTALANLAARISKPSARYYLYSLIQFIWARDQWLIALYYTPFVNAVSSQVHGFHQNPLGYYVFQGVTKP